MNNSFVNLVMIQLREFVREPEVLFWSLVFPIALSGVLGLAFANQDPATYQVAIVQNEHTGANPTLKQLQAFPVDAAFREGQPGFRFSELPKEVAFLKLKRGEVAVVVEPRASGITYHFDPQNEEAQMQYLRLEKRLSTPTQTVVAPVRTPGSRYIDFLIPGMLAYGTMNSCMWGIGWGLIELRIKKLLRRMVATPMRRTEFLLAQFSVRLLLSLVEGVVLFGFAYWLFGIRIQGGLLPALVVFLAANVTFGGIAILVAARPTKTQVGNGVINFVTLTMLVLSGIFFNYTSFPAWAVHFIAYLPLTLAADTLRSVFNEGSGLAEVTSKVLLMLAYGVACFLAGLRWFRWY